MEGVLSDPRYKRIDDCLMCKDEKIIHARGMCRSCYIKDYYLRNPDKLAMYRSKHLNNKNKLNRRRSLNRKYSKRGFARFKAKYGFKPDVRHKPGRRVLAGSAKLPGTVWGLRAGVGAKTTYPVKLDDGYGVEWYSVYDLKFLSHVPELMDEWNDARLSSRRTSVREFRGDNLDTFVGVE